MKQQTLGGFGTPAPKYGEDKPSQLSERLPRRRCGSSLRILSQPHHHRGTASPVLLQSHPKREISTHRYLDMLCTGGRAHRHDSTAADHIASRVIWTLHPESDRVTLQRAHCVPGGLSISIDLQQPDPRIFGVYSEQHYTGNFPITEAIPADADQTAHPGPAANGLAISQAVKWWVCWRPLRQNSANPANRAGRNHRTS